MLRALVMPPASLLLVALVGVLLAWRGRRAGLGIALAGLSAAWLFGTYAVAYGLLSVAEAGQRPFDRAAWDAARAGSPAPGAVVILGGGAVVDGPHAPDRARLAPRTVQRALEGARIARMTGLPVLVTGGTPPWLNASEAALMRDMLERELAVPVRWVEADARTTAENATLSARLLRADGVQAIVLVTHAYHMARAGAAFEAAGLVVHPAPHDWLAGPPAILEARAFWPTAEATVLAWIAAHELVGRLWYRLSGSI